MEETRGQEMSGILFRLVYNIKEIILIIRSVKMMVSLNIEKHSSATNTRIIISITVIIIIIMLSCYSWNINAQLITSHQCSSLPLLLYMHMLIIRHSSSGSTSYSLSYSHIVIFKKHSCIILLCKQWQQSSIHYV